jgi:hypothetical protein
MPKAHSAPHIERLEITMAKEPKKLDDLFHDTLKDIYFAEKKILSTLPKMAKAAQSEELKAAFEKHHGETEGQIERLEEVFALIEKKPQGKTAPCAPGPKSWAWIKRRACCRKPWTKRKRRTKP